MFAADRGTIIEQIIKIERTEDIHFIFEDADCFNNNY